MYGFVTDSPLFDNPQGFYRSLTDEEDIRLRASAQQAMEAGRPMTMAEMYGKPQQLFRKLSGFGEGRAPIKLIVISLAVIGLVAWLAYTKLPEVTTRRT